MSGPRYPICDEGRISLREQICRCGRALCLGGQHLPNRTPVRCWRKRYAAGRKRRCRRVGSAGSHIVCLPSKFGEGVPKVLPAAAAGRAVVAADTPGCREVIEDGVEGLMVPTGDSAALAVALRRLIDEPGLRDAMGTAADGAALLNFGVGHVVEGTLESYRDLRGLHDE
jgi:hypothetical protein